MYEKSDDRNMNCHIHMFRRHGASSSSQGANAGVVVNP
jgi:hypothetical protein